MIDGTEPIYPTTDNKYINNSDDAPTIGLWGGINLKQHMVIEFTKNGFDTLPERLKVFVVGENEPTYSTVDVMNGGMRESHTLFNEEYLAWIIKGRAKYGIMQANEVIKQLNDEDGT